jgi:hypothetical protein
MKELYYALLAAERRKQAAELGIEAGTMIPPIKLTLFL